jgi:hypothetical protein
MRRVIQIAIILLYSLLTVESGLAGPMIVGHTGNGVIATFDFATGGPATASFVPTGADTTGSGVEVVGNTVYYTTLLFAGGIHVAPYNGGLGGPDTGIIPNPRPGAGIQCLDYSNGSLYALTGHSSGGSLMVYRLNPNTGAVIGAPVTITGPNNNASAFTVLPNGDFLINDGGGSETYRSYSSSTGLSTGLAINLPTLNAGGMTKTSGVDYSCIDNMLYFHGLFLCQPQDACPGLGRTDLSGNGFTLCGGAISFPGGGAIRDISVLRTCCCPDLDSAELTACATGAIGPSNCLRILNEIVFCDCWTSAYKVKSSIRNQTSTPVYSLAIGNINPSGVTVSPTVGSFGPPLNPGEVGSRVFIITGPAAVPGATVCYEIILRNQAGDEICRTCHCVTLPDCQCATVINESIVAATIPNTYTYKFRLQNRLYCDPNWFSAAHVFLASISPAVNFSPSGFNLTGAQIPACTSPTSGMSGYLTSTITMPNGNGGAPCFHIITTNADVNCSCKAPSHCITVPPWVQPGVCCYPCPLNGSYSAINIGPAACSTLAGTYNLPPPPGSFGNPLCLCYSLWNGVNGMSFFGLAHPEFVLGEEPMFSVVFDGFTGQDGVCFQLNSSNEVRIDIAPLDAAFDLVAGSSITALAHGTVNGQPGQDVGSLTCRSTGSGGKDDVEIIAEFGPVGAATHRIIVTNQDVIVADISGHSGTVGIVPLMPEHFARGRANGAPTATVGWSTPVDVMIGDGPMVTGSALRVIAENPAQPIVITEDSCLSFNGTPDILILNVSAGSISGDTNCDDTIVTSDIQPFVVAMLDPTAYAVLYPDCDEFSADMNSDGLIDARDIQLFVAKLLNP